MNNNYDKIIWIILFFVFIIIIGLYISQFTPLNLDQKKKALELDIITEDFTCSSSTNDQAEGASALYKWGLPEDEVKVKSKSEPVHERTNWWNTWWHPDKEIIKCPIINENINVHLDKHYTNMCNNCDITKNRDIDKYVLKSSVPPCQDMSKFVTKNMMNANPDLSDYILKSEIKPCEEKKVDLSQYVLKSAIPACPTCPICPECPICPICTNHAPVEHKEKKIFEYNITDHPDISKYISIDEVNKKYMKKEDCKKEEPIKKKEEPIKKKEEVKAPKQEPPKRIENDRSNSGMYNQFTEKIFSKELDEKDLKILSGDGYYAGDNLYAAV
jgi:hypothetical protein